MLGYEIHSGGPDQVSEVGWGGVQQIPAACTPCPVVLQSSYFPRKYGRAQGHLLKIQSRATVGPPLFMWKIIQLVNNNTGINSVSCTLTTVKLPFFFHLVPVTRKLEPAALCSVRVSQLLSAEDLTSYLPDVTTGLLLTFSDRGCAFHAPPSVLTLSTATASLLITCKVPAAGQLVPFAPCSCHRVGPEVPVA